MKEADLVRKILEKLRKENCYAVKFHGNNFTRAGVPDILACYKGLFLALECKIKPNKPSPLQRLNIEQIRASNGYAFVVYSYDDVKKLLEFIDEKGLANNAAQNFFPRYFNENNYRKREEQAEIEPSVEQKQIASTTAEIRGFTSERANF